MTNKAFFILYILLLTLNNSQASDYLCPKTPVTITVGEHLADKWFVWPHGKPHNIFKKYYYLYFPERYNFNSWSEYPNGVRTGNIKGNKYFIACCNKVSSLSNLICAYKYIKEKNCKLKIFNTIREKFICK